MRSHLFWFVYGKEAMIITAVNREAANIKFALEGKGSAHYSAPVVGCNCCGKPRPPLGFENLTMVGVDVCREETHQQIKQVLPVADASGIYDPHDPGNPIIY